MKNFQDLLDRYGADLDRWPTAEAEQAKRFLLVSSEARSAQRALARLESWIVASQPRVSEAGVRRVIDGSIAFIEAHAPRMSVIDRFRLLLAAPVPRVAFVMGLTAIGFALGVALGAPEFGASEAAGGHVLTASADDVLF
jgi:hypothetical protein